MIWMSRSSNDVVILIPAFNEESTIGTIITDCLEYGHVLVVDDASSDSTKKIASNLANKVISLKANKGYDVAIATGITSAINDNYKILVIIDADGEHPKENLKTFIQYIENGYSLVVGNRDKKNRFLENIYSYYSYYFFGLYDPLCGMKAYDLNEVKGYMNINSYTSLGTELALKMIKDKKNFFQVNIIVNKREDHSRIGNSLKANTQILYSMFKSLLI